ncbi:MAG: LPS assembly protein LptD, partial [Gammaproteobacteria bacterium]
AGIETFQVIDQSIQPGQRPFAKLPAVRINYAELFGPLGITYGGLAAITRFVKSNSFQGDRIFMKPKLSWRNKNAGWFAQPVVGFQAISYNLDQTDGTSSEESVAAPIVSFDSGLIFEREMKKDDFFQTLEPRLYYLYVPTRDHTGIPDFDTSLKDINFDALFSDNRFVGGDRIGDANQVSLAISTNILDGSSGETVFSASIGQIFHFQDREVTLDAIALPDTSDRSPVVGELRLNTADWWSASATAAWDSEINRLEKYGLQFRFLPATDTIINLSYRFRRNTQTIGRSNGIEQTDLSFAAPVTKRWKTVGRWQYSLEDRRSLETFIWFEYESCCFAIRVVNRRFIVDNFGNTDRQLFLQLELKGMTSVGRNVDDFLEEGIFGYE